MPLGLAMHGKWDGISMASPSLHPFKHERPAYSTPLPVENTPSNNECRTVELRGSKVACFIIGGDEFICLPQAFDLFLKHLVGGLHTVYTKLKRLSISPIVCNVEQVRILRGLGAIQPGVNRCKLITRRDFEILYQDCAQASRPGRPPKRYPMLPPTTDLASHYQGIRSMAHGMLGASDLNTLQKRIRLEQDVEKQLHQQQERRLSGSPQRDTTSLSSKDLSIVDTNNMQANAASLYLQGQQALRQHYQQAASSGIHNGMDTQQAMAVAGMNPALAPLMMMSHPALFSGAFSPNMLSHINQLAQNRGNSSAVTSAAAAAAAQIAVNGGNMHQQAAAAYQVAAAAQTAAQAALVSAAASAKNSPPRGEDGVLCSSAQDEKTAECEGRSTSKNSPAGCRLGENVNGSGSDEPDSPQSSISSLHRDNNSVLSPSPHSESGDSLTFVSGTCEAASGNPNGEHGKTENPDQKENHCPDGSQDIADEDDGTGDRENRSFLSATSLGGPDNVSSMQTLLTNIQGLLKVAADNARLQDKHSSSEIADLKNRMALERQIRGSAEKKLMESEKNRAIIHRRLKKERKDRKILEEQLDTMKQKLGQENCEPVVGKIAAAPSIPITGVLGSGRDSATSRPAYATSRHQSSPSGPSRDANASPTSSTEHVNTSPQLRSQSQVLTASMPPSTSSFMSSPVGSEECVTFSSPLLVSNSNTNSSNNKTMFVVGGDCRVLTPTIQYTNDRKTAADFEYDASTQTGQREVTENVPAHHMFFNAGRYQTTATQ